MMTNSKEDAYAFLRGLSKRFADDLPGPTEMPSVMKAIEDDPYNLHKIRENRFLYQALPIVHRHVQSCAGLTSEEARRAMVCEYFSKVPEISSANGLRRTGHPFQKQLGQSKSEIFKRWLKPKSTFPLNQTYPDFALRSPLPYSIVFDAKYFTRNSESAAQNALVEGVYEAAFYRGLPSDGAGWDYDYAYLLAYDASENRTLRAAWSSVVQKDVFWGGANVFIMIL